MTRKRFKKLVMSAGYDRNTAEYIADVAISDCGSYKAAWEKIRYRMLFSRACHVLKTSISAIRNSIASSIAPVLNKLKNSLKQLQENNRKENKDV